MVSSNASLSPAEIISAATLCQPLFFQLYKSADDDVAEKRVRHVEQLGYKAIFLTVDAVVPANREEDVRSPWILEDEEKGAPTVYNESDVPGNVNVFGTAGALIVKDDRDMTWEKVIFMSSFLKQALISEIKDYSLAAKSHEAADCHQR